MANAILIESCDSVVTATEPIERNTALRYTESGSVKKVTVNDDIPIYHKVAVNDIEKGQYVYKYGEKIGLASVDIYTGDHVHTHNIKSSNM